MLHYRLSFLDTRSHSCRLLGCVGQVLYHNSLMVMPLPRNVHCLPALYSQAKETQEYIERERFNRTVLVVASYTVAK